MYAIEPRNPQGRIHVIILGLILLILGFVFGVSILWTIGIILLVVGAVLYLLGATGRAVGGRNHYY
jgi:predicted acyltransferase